MPGLAEKKATLTKPKLFKKLAKSYFFTKGEKELPQSKFYTARSGVNTLITAAQPIISIIARIRQSPNLKVLSDLKRSVQHELQVFEKHSLQNGINMEQVLIGRYCLSAMLDEVMLDSALKDEWRQCQLLPTHNDQELPEEQFFKLAERLQQRPEQNIVCLELIYLLVSLGFQGKYHTYPNKDRQLNLFIDKLYEAIRLYRGCYQTKLLIEHQSRQVEVADASALPRTSILLIVAVLFVFVGFYYVLDVSAGFVVKEINNIVSWLI